MRPRSPRPWVSVVGTQDATLGRWPSRARRHSRFVAGLPCTESVTGSREGMRCDSLGCQLRFSPSRQAIASSSIGLRSRRPSRGAPGTQMQGTSSIPCEPPQGRRSPPTYAHSTRPLARRTTRSVAAGRQVILEGLCHSSDRAHHRDIRCQTRLLAPGARCHSAHQLPLAPGDHRTG